MQVVPIDTTLGFMAKLSVSIPDELLDRARALDASANTSQLVQRGLEQLTMRLSTSRDPDYAERPADADAQLSAAREALLASARTEFQRGYREALEDVGNIDWRTMENLADHEFNLFTVLEGWRSGWDVSNGFSPPEWFQIFMKRFGAMIDPIGFDQFSFTPSRPYVRGYAAALRDAWATVEPGVDGAEANSEGSE
jgi:post-segregation antitoxin (ccd killing protein)